MYDLMEWGSFFDNFLLIAIYQKKNIEAQPTHILLFIRIRTF